jgi:hypothetical protein
MTEAEYDAEYKADFYARHAIIDRKMIEGEGWSLLQWGRTFPTRKQAQAYLHEWYALERAHSLAEDALARKHGCL